MESALNLATERYRTGLDPYRNVMTAQPRSSAISLTEVTLHMNEMMAAVELVQTLGGWKASDLAFALECNRKQAATQSLASP